MKKIMISTALFMLSLAFKANAQSFTIWNNTTSDLDITIYADPSGGTCAAMVSSYILTVLSGTQAGPFAAPVHINKPVCGAYGGPGWSSGCWSAGGSDTWDGVDIAISGGSPFCSIGGGCFGSTSYSGGGITAIWDIVNFSPNIYLRIHN